MCINLKKIYTNSHFLSTEHYMPFEMVVPCGKCVECVGRKKMDYSVRSYYEAQRCLERGGFMLFDTLTYSDKNIPFIHDHYKRALYNCYDRTCFNRKHVTNFFKMLRSWLVRDGYDAKDNLRYFLSSEYGTSLNCTHRPHYHVLFYVNFDIHPYVLSRYIALAWPYGRTDGWSYKSYCYIMNNRVIRDNTPHSLNVIKYVAKYVAKDSYYNDMIVRRLNHMFDIIFHNHDNWRLIKSCTDLYTKVYRQVSQFHVESKNFGGFALERFSVDDLLENNNIALPTHKSNVVDYVPLPAYYTRKLLYEQFWFNGKRYWRLNKLGLKYKKDLLLKSVERLENKIKAFLNEVRPDKSYFNYLYSLLRSSSTYDVAYYSLCLRGRVKPMLSPSVSFDKVMEESLNSEAYNPRVLINSDICIYPYNHSVDRLRFGRQFVSSHYLGDSSYWKYHLNPLKVQQIKVISSSVFASENTIQIPSFNEFLDCFNDWLAYYGQLKQIQFDEIKYRKYHYEKNGILKSTI